VNINANWHNIFLNSVQRILRLYCKVWHDFQYHPIPLPEQGAAVVISNHISGLDPILMTLASPRPLRFLIAQEEYQRWGLQWFFKQVGCIPVDRQQRPEIALRTALRALQAGEVIALFPQGGITLDHEQAAGKALKKGCVWLAQKQNCPIIPLHISGVGGIGKTMLALLIPSHARVSSATPYQCEQSAKHCLADLQDLILAKKSNLVLLNTTK